MDVMDCIGLTDLSSEVLTLILQKVSLEAVVEEVKLIPAQLLPKDLKSLCEVSKQLYEVATPQLYERIVIRCEEGFNPRTTDCEKFSRKPGELECSFGLVSVRELTVDSRSPDLFGAYCYHTRPLDPSEDEAFDINREHDYDEGRFFDLCKYLRDNKLTSFTYGNFTHVPHSDSYSSQLEPGHL